MTDSTLLETEHRTACERAARRLVANNGWALTDDWPAFVDEVVAALAQGRGRPGQTLQQRAERAVMRAYCPRLYHACCERRGPRAERAFDELGRYLHAIARAECRDPEVARDTAQRAVELVWSHLDSVRDPSAFLGYARTILAHELGAAHQAQQAARRVLTLVGDTHAEEGVNPPDPRADEERDRIEHAAADTQLLQALRDCLHSRQQLEVVIRLFLDEESVTSVARKLNTTPANIWVLKSRALSRLRLCPDVTRLVAE